MAKTKKNLILTILLLLSISIACCSYCFINGNYALAAQSTDEGEVAQPYGLIAQVSISIGSYSDSVGARAHNDFTLGLSTVQVYLYLYSSLEEESDYTKMTLEAYAYIGDLNFGKTLEITAPINGVKRYWRARMKTKLDNRDWKYKETETYLVDVNGEVIR